MICSLCHRLFDLEQPVSAAPFCPYCGSTKVVSK
jgi:DNA-directed RNA polymerase subunit RPC12/RpoP